MEPDTRKILDQIDDFLSKMDSEASELWSVLAALRGPDGRNMIGLKERTTVLIRRAAFPKTSNAIDRGYEFCGRFQPWPGDPQNLQSSFKILDGDDDKHFADHAREAAWVLDLPRNSSLGEW